MKRVLILFIFFLSIAILSALPVAPNLAESVAMHQLQRLGAEGFALREAATISGADGILAYRYLLQPKGYMVVSADDRLDPVIAYSLQSDYAPSVDNPLEDLIITDLSQRLQNIPLMSETQLDMVRENWTRLSTGQFRDPLQQWPPAGSTPTGGWVKTEWTQNAPYNSLCPINQTSGAHTYAGCPAVAMGQIVNYYQTINGTVFSDTDDYYHSYGGNNYNIDDDHTAWGFPSWSELNGYLNDMTHHYNYQEDMTDTDKAALIFACGAAGHQVYNYAGSGTFAVSQMLTAFQRFGFEGMELLTDTAPDLYSRISANIMDAMPVHLAVVTPAWDSGHNVVVDGYNTDNYFHLNFGWGGQYSGWYLLPSQIPYGLTVIEGAIVDIAPREYFFVFPEELSFMTFEDTLAPQPVEFINISGETLNMEAVLNQEFVAGGIRVQVTTSPTLPCQLPAGQSFILNVRVDTPTNLPREILETNVRLIHSQGVVDIPVRINSELNSEVNDGSSPALDPSLSVYPNPFRNELRIRIKEYPEHDPVGIYNLKGQLVRTLSCESNSDTVWDGKDSAGRTVANGIYLIKQLTDKGLATARALKLSH
ncbi:MAG TPA: C10 family peptidase [Candidatus Cloacimonadota bacterium]|nr:C10 family peptidase [Candidatus Cloacimonadota bacterium]